MKKILSLLLCAVMLCTMGVPFTVAAKEAGTEITVDSISENEKTKPYDPNTDGDYQFEINASYDTSKSYTAGDKFTITFTLTTDADTLLDMSNAYLYVRGKQEYLTGATVSKDKPYEKKVEVQVPWDQEYDSWWVYYWVGMDGQEYNLCGGDINIDTVPITPIIENGEYRFPNPDAPVRYLITFKLGNGVKSYGDIGGGGGDARYDYHEDTGITDYYLRPGYMSSFGFDVDDEYVVEDEYGYVSGLKEGYALEFKLLEGDCTLTYYDYTPLMAHFDISEPSVYEVSIVKKEKTFSDPSGVKVTLPEADAADLSLKVDISDGEGEKAAVEKVVPIDGDRIRTYNLSMLMNGKPFTYNGQFVSTVALPIPEGWNTEQLALYYFNEETDEVSSVPFTVDQENSLAVFETNHFSKYILVQKAKSSAGGSDITGDPETAGDSDKIHDGQNDAVEKTEQEKNIAEKNAVSAVQTGDTANVWFWSSICLLTMAGVLFVIRMKRNQIR